MQPLASLLTLQTLGVCGKAEQHETDKTGTS